MPMSLKMKYLESTSDDIGNMAGLSFKMLNPQLSMILIL